MLINNINYLREKYPCIREQLKNIEDNKDNKFTLEGTRSGDKTLLYKDDEKEVYFHSKYNPIREAESLIEEYKEIKGQNIIFYGTGLGYHIDLLMTENPHNDYYIFEPIPELLEAFLSANDLTEKQYKNLKKLSTGMQNMIEDINSFVQINKKSVCIIELPTHKQVFENEFKIFNEIFLNMVKSKRNDIATNYNFQRRWIVNSMINFKDVLVTPNILMEKKNKFKGKPAILVSAGPSLDEEIENLKYIKKNGLAYIFAVGSSIRTLLNHEIYPDALTTYDPKTTNHEVIKVVKDKEIKGIPLIFGSSVGQKTLLNYPGNKYHMVTSQDSISSYFLETENRQDIPIIKDAPSIAIITLQLLNEMGFSKIILVGQNLGYIGKKQYSVGVTYRKELTDSEIEEGITTKDVYGKDILTNEMFNIMREQMENYIEVFKKIEFINTTKGGASIKGTAFKDLSLLIDSDLKERVVEDNWLDGNEIKYDKDYLLLKLNQMEKEYKKVSKINKKYYEILNKMERLLERRNFKQLDNLYVDLEKELKKIRNNDFYDHMILPINRVEYKILADNIAEFNEIKDPYEKGKKIVSSCKGFMNKCVDDIEEIKPIYEEMIRDIKNHIEN